MPAAWPENEGGASPMNQNRDNVSQRERMLAGLPYKPWLDGLPEARERAQAALL